MSSYEAVLAGRMPPPVTVCVEYPPHVNSVGLWNRSGTGAVNISTPLGHLSLPLQNYTIPVLEFEMTLIFLVTQISHLLLTMFGLPVFAAQLLAGVLLGDAGLGRMIKTLGVNPIFPFANQEILNIISMFGYALFSFLIGVQMDLGLISKIGKKALYTGIIIWFVPLLTGFGILICLHFKSYLLTNEVVQFPFILSFHALSPSPVISVLLGDLKILNSELGRLALSSALVTDVWGIALTCAAMLSKVVHEQLVKGVTDIVVMTLYTLLVCFAGRPIMFWMIRKTPEGKPVKDSYIFYIFLAFLVSGLLSHWCDLPIVVGPLIFGVAVPDGPPLGATLVKKLDFMVNKIFMPIFVTTTMMRVNILEPVTQAAKNAVIAAAVVIHAMQLAKFVASLVTPLYCKMAMKDAVAFALVMSTKGVVEISGYALARDSRVISDGIFNVTMLSVIMTGIAGPPLVRLFYDPKKKYAAYQKRNLLDSNPDSEFRILACINRADNTPAIINLVDASCPTQESPIALYVVHLIELVARDAPILISHNLQRKALSNYSYSQNVILSFSHFQRENEGALAVQVFTAVSPPEYMYDDVCTLAIDKGTSLIILPFHRKWSSIEGCIESENLNTRALNCSVLETAPCSVGILVNRGYTKCTNSSISPKETYKVAMIFIGGNDDREALTFAKRMVKDSCISMTVIQFVDTSEEEESYDNWGWVQDNEILKEVKYNHGGVGLVSFLEEQVHDGDQTTRKIRSLMDENEYDLFIVGRRYNERSRQTMGLEQWSEFPELGVIGDMLSAADSRCNSSVLVIQQQLQRQAM